MNTYLRACLPIKCALVLIVPVNGTTDEAQHCTWNEAPSLSRRVSAGELPALEERLPRLPFVVKPIDGPGRYGGSLNLLGMWADNAHRIRILGYETLFAFDVGYKKVIPHLAIGYSVNDDATEYVIALRPGVRWSDGHPYTAADIEYGVNHVLGSNDYTGERPPFFSSHDAMRAEIIDEYTIRLHLTAPNALLPRQLASALGPFLASWPRHYCTKFQPAFNVNADAIAQASGVSSWQEHFFHKCGSIVNTSFFANPDRPHLGPWIVSVPPTAGGQTAVFERNPYFWQVDTVGNQLPYLDRVRFSYSENREDMLIRAIAGETDFQSRHLDTPSSRPLLFDSQTRGGYRLALRQPSEMNTLVLNLNLTSKDPLKRLLFNNKKFRIALSYGIDREQINQAIFAGLSEPWQAAPRIESPYYSASMAKQYTQHDPLLANRILDDLGLSERDKQGYRLMANGETLRLHTPIISNIESTMLDTIELIRMQWKQIGIRLDLRVVDRTLQLARRDSGNFDLLPWRGDGGIGVIDDPRYYLPINAESSWALGWVAWSTDPGSPKAVDPPAPVRQQLALWRKLKATTDSRRQSFLLKAILSIAEEEFYNIGTVLPLRNAVVIRDTLRNAPDNQIQSWIYPTPSPMQLGQLWKTDTATDSTSRTRPR